MKPKEYVVQGNYGFGHGWEDLTSENTKAEGLARLREYRMNEPSYAHRMIIRTVKQGAELPGE